MGGLRGEIKPVTVQGLSAVQEILCTVLFDVTYDSG